MGNIKVPGYKQAEENVSSLIISNGITLSLVNTKSTRMIQRSLFECAIYRISVQFHPLTSVLSVYKISPCPQGAEYARGTGIYRPYFPYVTFL